MVEEMLDAVRRHVDTMERCEHADNHAPADQLLLVALQVRALVQSSGTLGMLVDERAQLDQHTVKLCVDLASIALHIANRVQR